MIVFLYGPDSYRRLARKSFYRAQFEKKYGKAARELDLAEDGALAQLEEAGRSSGLFGAKELFLLGNAYEVDAKSLALALSLFAHSKDKSLLLSEEKKPVKALGMLLKKPVVSEEIEFPAGAALTVFIKKEAEAKDVALDAGAVSLLAAVYGKDAWGLATELLKIASLRKPVTRVMLSDLGLEAPEGNYWALVNGIRSERGAVRLATLGRLLSMGEPAAKIFNIICPMWGARIRQFARYDEMIKTGKLEYEEALSDAVLA